MHEHSATTTIRHLVQALRKRAHVPRAGSPARTGGDAPSSTLFMHSTLVPQATSTGNKGSSSSFKIRIARRPSVLQDALGLLNRRYRQRGYGFQTLTLSPERMTIVAYDKQQVIGTLTVQLDAGCGLLSDECFREELDGFRARGASLCEFTKLATAPHAPMHPCLLRWRPCSMSPSSLRTSSTTPRTRWWR